MTVSSPRETPTERWPPVPDFCDPQLPHGWLRTAATTIVLGAAGREALGCDLAQRVSDHMAAIACDNAMCGFTVLRDTRDGTAAVRYRPGIVPAYTAVLRQTLIPWAEELRRRRFTVDVVCADDRGQAGVPQWLRITAWCPPGEVPGP